MSGKKIIRGLEEATREDIAELLAQALEGIIRAEKSNYFGPESEKNKRAAMRGAIRNADAALVHYRATMQHAGAIADRG